MPTSRLSRMAELRSRPNGFSMTTRRQPPSWRSWSRPTRPRPATISAKRRRLAGEVEDPVAARAALVVQLVQPVRRAPGRAPGRRSRPGGRRSGSASSSQASRSTGRTREYASREALSSVAERLVRVRTAADGDDGELVRAAGASATAGTAPGSPCDGRGRPWRRTGRRSPGPGRARGGGPRGAGSRPPGSGAFRRVSVARRRSRIVRGAPSRRERVARRRGWRRGGFADGLRDAPGPPTFASSRSTSGMYGIASASCSPSPRGPPRPCRCVPRQPPPPRGAPRSVTPMAMRHPFIECRVRLPAPPMPASMRRASPEEGVIELGIVERQLRVRGPARLRRPVPVELVQRSARSRTPGTRDASDPTKTSTRTYTSISANQASSVSSRLAAGRPPCRRGAGQS